MFSSNLVLNTPCSVIDIPDIIAYIIASILNHLRSSIPLKEEKYEKNSLLIIESF